ncbi:peptidase C39 family protein [Laceyella putida]|uniref:Peptidase C39 family protein n=1 Tax=Laceyella putida TaxID=110101 RepID=A0ABW2RIP7_9BACL
MWFASCVALVFSFSLFLAPASATTITSSNKKYVEVTRFFSGSFSGTRVTGSQLQLDARRLKQGTDSTGRYNQGSYYYGQWTSPVTSHSFNEAIASWQASTPVGTWIELELRAQVNGVWTKWYSMGVWLEHDEPFKRHSVSGQGDTHGSVATDTLILKKTATAYQTRINLFTTDSAKTPVLRAYGVSLANGYDQPGTVPSLGVNKALDVPMRSQMVFPDGGEVWCSPTSTSMVMAYWAQVTGRSKWNQPVPQVVNKVWDYVYDGAGNWPYNTAYAASQGLNAKVVRFSSLSQVERWIQAGVPVIVSIAYSQGELPGTPIPSSNGHLLVIRGFDQNGNVLTNDPAGPADDKVRITYSRTEFESVFLKHSNGTAYLIYPRGWSTPPRF